MQSQRKRWCTKCLLRITAYSFESELYQQGFRNIPLYSYRTGSGRSEVAQGPMLESYMSLKTNYQFLL